MNVKNKIAKVKLNFKNNLDDLFLKKLKKAKNVVSEDRNKIFKRNPGKQTLSYRDLDEEKKALQRQRVKDSMNRRLANMSKKELTAFVERRKEYQRQWYLTLTDEDKAERQRKAKIARDKRLAAMSSKELEEYRAKNRKSAKASYHRRKKLK